MEHTHISHGEACTKEGDYRAAITHFKEALSINNSNVRALNGVLLLVLRLFAVVVVAAVLLVAVMLVLLLLFLVPLLFVMLLLLYDLSSSSSSSYLARSWVRTP